VSFECDSLSAETWIGEKNKKEKGRKILSQQDDEIEGKAAAT
jgi:hypothetical protein